MSTQGTTLKKREAELMRAHAKLRYASDSLNQRMARFLHEHGLNAGQFSVLESLRDTGPVCQKELGQRLCSTEGNITQIVDNLEKRGLVERIRAASDRRFVNVHPRAEGLALIDRVLPLYTEALRGALDALRGTEIAALTDICDRLGQSLAES